jgi:hypothetical protein
MLLVSKKRWLHLILATYLAVSIMGIFTFMAIEPLCSIVFWEDRPVSGGCFTHVDYTIDCLAEGTAIPSKAKGYVYSPLRLVMPFGIRNSRTALPQIALKTIEKVNHINREHTIPLKLLT